MYYLEHVRKELKPTLQSFFDDLRDRKDRDFFRPTGTQIYEGEQGSGKTFSSVTHLNDIRKRYPKAIIVTNMNFPKMNAITFETKEELLREIEEGFDHSNTYIEFHEFDELAIALTSINNGKCGVFYLVDEIHTFFNSLDSKNIPPYIFTEISQQRKQRKCIVGTSQLFSRVAKPFREQVDYIMRCFTILGFFTVQMGYKGSQVNEFGEIKGSPRKIGWIFHTRAKREFFDTYQKVVSGLVQFESITNIKMDKKLLKN